MSKFTTLAGAPEGFDAYLIAQGVRKAGGLHLHVARDDTRASELQEALKFFDPGLQVLNFPAWDCLPYDRVSPKAEIAGARMAVLASLVKRSGKAPVVLITTVNAALQRVPPREGVAAASFAVRNGATVKLDELIGFLNRNGFARASSVVEPGDYAVRGGIVDVFPPGAEMPLRLDLFGDILETIRRFEAETQKSVGEIKDFVLTPVSE